jgi:uncharacterized protein (TIGR01319 family)
MTTKIDQMDKVFITDIGSTTTKGLLIVRKAGKWEFICEENGPTTVEKPAEDVKIGVVRVAKRIAEKTGIHLLDENDNLIVPYITTSSAGGGLQILVFGLSSFDTGKVAEMTAYGAGGVILKTFTIDDAIPAISKMRLIRDLHPDMILMAGGINGGNIASIIRLAEILSLAEPTPKFMQNEKIPLVFCGNVEARQFVKKTLDQFDVHLVDNIRPDMKRINSVPAKNKVHELFMDNVMERAPGYAGLKSWVHSDILPTPAGVEKIMTLYTDTTRQNTVMVDIGGATTDIFSLIKGNFSRTVSANTGMSYSLSNILAEAGIRNLLKHLDKSYSETIVRDYISNKMLNPTYIPQNAGETAIERAAAMEGIGLAWDQHLKMNYDVSRVGLLDRLKQKDDIDPFQAVFKGRKTGLKFQMSEIGMVIGSGGVMSHMTSSEAIQVLVEGFKPVGVTTLAVDSSFKSPHMGVLASLDSDLAIDLYQRECIQTLGTVIAPSGKIDPHKAVLSVIDKSCNGTFEIQGHNALFKPDGGNFEVTVLNHSELATGKETVHIQTDLPVLFDCRGRDQHFNGEPLNCFSTDSLEQFSTGVLKKSAVDCREGEETFQRRLPYDGKMFIKKGDTVQHDQIIGENQFTPPKIFIIDVQRQVGYDRKLSVEDIHKGLEVKVGDQINIGDKIFHMDQGTISGFNIYSQVRGKVIEIEPNGLLILREIQDYSIKPVRLKIARMLDIKPKYLKGHLKFKMGDYIQGGQSLIKLSGTIRIPAPITGILKEINTVDGTILIQYDTDPTPLLATVPGKISWVNEMRGADITGQFKILHGVIGFGRVNGGPAVRMPDNTIPRDVAGKVIISRHPLDAELLNQCQNLDISGVIAPSIPNIEWVSFYGREIGVALTGDEDIPFPVILTEGFGQVEMSPERWEYFSDTQGSIVTLYTFTQIRAGVSRPMIVIGE